MKYMGSKNRISKHLKPIIESYLVDKEVYIEPFVGGANMIDKIDFKDKIGSDLNEYLIELLKVAQNKPELIPDEITEEEYNKVKNNKESFEKWYVGLVGFCATFGAKWFGGYARDKKTGRNIPAEGIKNLKNQVPNLKNLTFKTCGYEAYKDVKNSVIYCDIPYSGTTKYKDSFDRDKFINFLLKLDESNVILVSEYEMPEDNFTKVFEKEVKVSISQTKKATEKLFILNKNKNK